MDITELYRARYDTTVEALARLLKNRADAEECTAEAFTVLSRMTAARDPEALLWTVAQRRAYDVLRRRETKPEILCDGDALAYYADKSDIGPGRFDGTTDIAEAEARADLTRAMAELLDIDRDAWALTELRGLSTYEAAEVLGVSQPTVSRRAERARLTLKGELS